MFFKKRNEPKMKNIIYFILTAISMHLSAQQLSVYDLRCGNTKNPKGIQSTPELSWKLKSGLRNINQHAYSIIVADKPDLIRKNIGNIWSSGKINSSASIFVIYKGPALQPAKTYYWKVKVWDNQGHTTNWSPTANWQTGLFTSANWQNAEWIALQQLPDSSRILPSLNSDERKLNKDEILPLLRKGFGLNRSIKKATIFIAGLGHFELHINGKKIGDHFLDAGWVDYSKEALYETFDVTNDLVKGDNALGVMLGNGFYFIPAERYHKLKTAYGYPKMICRLLIEYQDGTLENIVSDQSWKADTSPVTYSSIYGGEDYNANLEQRGWDKSGFNDDRWKAVLITSGPGLLYAEMQEPVKVFDHFKPKYVHELKPGIKVYNFGQNASAIFTISVKGNTGDTIRLIPAELLNTDGSVNQKATGSPYYFSYILKGAGMEKWEPRFAYYGFRFIQTELHPVHESSNTEIFSLEMKHIRNAAYDAGTFSCSEPLFNRIDTLIKWAVKSNMMSVFTDCPHRERLGWLEETHLMGSSVKYNFDILTLCRKVIHDMKNAATADGLIPAIAPEFAVFNEPFRDSPEWGSACILLPWYVYQWYGDKQVLNENYDMMQHYVAYLKRKSLHNILAYGLSDWYDIGPEKSGFAQMTPMGLTATAIYYYDVTILSNIAGVLEKKDDRKMYLEWGAEVKKAFNSQFFDKENMQYGTGSQTSNSMAVYMGLVNPEDKSMVVDNIVKELEKNDYKLSAGDIGFRYLIRVLDQDGRSEVIYKMNNRDDVPGYGYQLKHGATALTESWQAYASVSNNHFMLGHLMEWLYDGLAGIDQEAGSVGFKTIKIRPEIVGNIHQVQGTYLSPYGTIATEWNKIGMLFTLQVKIPPNTTAVVYLPASNIDEIRESAVKWKGKVIYQNGKAIIKVGSGVYNFSVSYKN